jgi:hypothetical protein
VYACVCLCMRVIHIYSPSMTFHFVVLKDPAITVISYVIHTNSSADLF